MSLTQALIAEIKNESASTQKLLERIPADQLTWKPHEKSMDMKKLATHIAVLAGWPGVIAQTNELDLASAPQPGAVNSAEDLVKILDEGVQKSIEALENIQDEDLNQAWSLKHGDHVIFNMPKAATIRSFALNHLIHHRAQLGVYLRMLNVPIPGMYGPSADDQA